MFHDEVYRYVPSPQQSKKKIKIHKHINISLFLSNFTERTSILLIRKHTSFKTYYFVEIEERLRLLNVRVELLEQRNLVLAVPPRVIGNSGSSWGRQWRVRSARD